MNPFFEIHCTFKLKGGKRLVISSRRRVEGERGFLNQDISWIFEEMGKQNDPVIDAENVEMATLVQVE